MTDEASPALDVPPPAELRSAVVFSAMLLLVLGAVSFPEMPPQALLGVLWMGAGLLMFLLPPETSLPRSWIALAAGFILASMTGFLPKTLFHLPQWRAEVESLGLDTGPYTFLQPQLAAESMAGFAVTAILAVYLLGHRVTTRLHHRLAIAFTLGIGLWAAMALLLKRPEENFGFFPNRNHTATLLAMGVLTGLGCFSKAIRLRQPWTIGLSGIPAALCLYAILFASESRAGIVLLVAGFVIWILLTGFSSLRGHTGKAVLLLFMGFSGLFLIVDSKVKTRLIETVERIEMQPKSEDEAKLSFREAPASKAEPQMDGRISIYKDTWNMIRHEPWTGVGPGQFAQVFPQYREKTNASNDSKCFHPESDWLMMLAENGWASTFCLLAGICLVFYTAVKRAWFGRARSLKMGTLVAAMILCIHGIFDIPGHRIGLAWAAALLLAISLRPSVAKANRRPLGPPIATSLVWRSSGIILTFAGIVLLHAQATSSPILPSARVQLLVQETKALYDADQAAYELATAAGREYDLPAAEDPLEKALVKLGEAIAITPLDPSLHYFRGALALHFDNKPTIVNTAFAIQLKLDPSRIRSPMEQAQAWATQSPEQVRIHWEEALRRATQVEASLPQCYPNAGSIFNAIMQAAGKDEGLNLAALKLAGTRFELIDIWAQTAPPALLDREVPSLIKTTQTSAGKKKLLSSWSTRGSKSAVEEFSRSHPEINMSDE